jgi:general secretion pathway protein B
MSYILEALQQSEQARLQTDGSRQNALLPMIGEGNPRRHWDKLLLGLLLMINVLVLYPHTNPNSQASAPSTTTEHTTSPVEGAQIKMAQAPALPPPNHAEATIEPSRAQPAPSPPAPRVQSVRSQHEAIDAKNNTPTKSDPSRPPAPTRNESATPLDMPLEIKKQLPPLAVAGYIQDGESNNMVIINDKLLREGDDVEPGLKLEQILNGSIVLSFKGYRFKH